MNSYPCSFHYVLLNQSSTYNLILVKVVGGCTEVSGSFV